MKKCKYIWMNGKFIDWQDAKIHVLSHALHYGTAVFEGVRAYETQQGPAIFRAKRHYDRLFESAKIIQMDIPFTAPELIEVTRELISKNDLKSCYIRPIAYFGYQELGLNPGVNPIEVTIATWEWGTYLGQEGLEKGIRCKMSSWARHDSRIMSPLAKTSANYVNSGMAKREAIRCGYDEAILLNINGFVAEGPGENLFLIKDNVIYTPPVQDCALKGITAQSVMTIAKNLGFDVQYKSLIRDELMLADELFFTGTAAEVTPIREIDGNIIGNGKRGPITTQLQKEFFNVVAGKNNTYSNWLTYTQ
ncbi:branched chain amino acid aminotransferase [Candidatus Marinamargulisbacteria bacterium SCGC AG-414-C22]|nr:branched chain amino acid aminotransferase [Candidatus Marinamargulisbacteria bacterium SCGC AG-414-C22]